MNALYGFSFLPRCSGSGMSSYWASASVYRTSEFWSHPYVLFSAHGHSMYIIAYAYLFLNHSHLIIDIPLLPEVRVGWWISIRCQGKSNPVGDNLMIVKEFCLIDFNVPLQCFSSLGTKPVVPVIQAITNLYV